MVIETHDMQVVDKESYGRSVLSTGGVRQLIANEN